MMDHKLYLSVYPFSQQYWDKCYATKVTQYTEEEEEAKHKCFDTYEEYDAFYSPQRDVSDDCGKLFKGEWEYVVDGDSDSGYYCDIEIKVDNYLLAAKMQEQYTSTSSNAGMYAGISFGVIGLVAAGAIFAVYKKKQVVPEREKPLL